MLEILRGLALYVAYATVVGGLLLHLVKPAAEQPVNAPYPTPSLRVVTLSVVDGDSEQSVECPTLSESVGADALVVHSLADLEELFHSLDCGRR